MPGSTRASCRREMPNHALHRPTLHVDLDASAVLGCHATAALLKKCENAGWRLDKWWERGRSCTYESSLTGVVGSDAVLIWRYRYPPEAYFAAGVATGHKKPLLVLVPFFAEPPCAFLRRFVPVYDPDRPGEDPISNLLRTTLLRAARRGGSACAALQATEAAQGAVASVSPRPGEAARASGAAAHVRSRRPEEQENAADGPPNKDDSCRWARKVV